VLAQALVVKTHIRTLVEQRFVVQDSVHLRGGKNEKGRIRRGGGEREREGGGGKGRERRRGGEEEKERGNEGERERGKGRKKEGEGKRDRKVREGEREGEREGKGETKSEQMGKGQETSARRSRTVMATYAPPDLFLIHFWASARYSSASLARLAAMAAIPSSDSRYLLLYFWKKASESTEREPRSAARSNTNSCTRWPCCHVAGPRSQKQRALTLLAAFPPSDSSYFWKKASESTEREPRSAARSNTNSCTRWPCCHVAGPRSQKQRALTLLAAFPPTQTARTLRISGKKRASQQRENHGQLRAPTQTAARAGRAVTLLARAVKNSVHSPYWRPFPPRTLRISGKKRASQQRENHGQLRAPTQTAARAGRAVTLLAAQSKTACTHPIGGLSLLGLSVFLEKASESTEREPRSAARSNTNSCTRWPCCHVAGPRSQKQRALTLLAAFPPSDSSYFWKKASQSTEREPGELRAPTQTAARAGRAVTLLARAVKNSVHSPFWRPFPPRTLRISGKKRASQRRDSHGQLHAPCCRRWPSCTLAVQHVGRAARPTCAGHHEDYED
jgi:hypothetical protein